VPEWVPGGEPGCTLRAGIGQGRLDWQGARDYAWDVVEGVGLPGAMAVDALAGTNGTQQILDDASTGTYLGVAFTGVTTLGSMQSGGAISNAALRGQVWLTSGSRLATGVGLVGLGLNAADEGALWLRTMQGDCAAFGEWAALQQLGAADGLLPFGDVLAAGGLLLPMRRGRVNPIGQQGPFFVQQNGIATRELGPGTWQPVTEHMSNRARTYQQRITGIAPDVGHVVNGVKFDGYRDGILLDAKDRYAQFVDRRTGTFYSWYRGAQGLVDQASRQIQVAGSTPIVWHVSEPNAATAIRSLLQNNGLSSITVVYTP
jgi:hypothetical protein